MRVVADAIIMSTIANKFGETLPGANQNFSDALNFLYRSAENLVGLTNESFVWSAAREEFVENFTRLAMRSQMQVGHNTRKSFADIESFVKQLVEKDST